MNETILNLNGISEQFSEIFYKNNDDDIKIDLIHFSGELSNGNLEQYNIIKMFEALMGYCGNKKINLNKYFVLNC